LVRCVTPLVKLSNLLTMLPAVRSIPPTTVPANAAPGRVGKLICPPPEEERPLLLPPLPMLPALLRAERTLGTQGR
jgi:hypothetical protein